MANGRPIHEEEDRYLKVNIVGDKWYVLLDLMVLVLRLGTLLMAVLESLKGGFVTVETPRKTRAVF